MRVDVSEIKSMRACKRQHHITSRNAWKVAPKVKDENLIFGVIFHESMHALYAGGSAIVDQTIEAAVREFALPGDKKMIENMIRGYAEKVLPADLDDYWIIDIEHYFQLDNLLRGIEFAGSIDMLAIRKSDYALFGFEHKSAKNFKEEFLLKFDEQPRMYTLALKNIIEHIDDLKLPEALIPHKKEIHLGGILFNETRKLQTKFEHKRTLCTYTDADLEKFIHGISRTCAAIVVASTNEELPDADPGMVKCSMCSCKNICEFYGYASPNKEEVLEEFKEEFMENETDHLDEKSERLIAVPGNE
jgi:CRISPR/Cas system-associated exonuclease Cas4 (RecB family)